MNTTPIALTLSTIFRELAFGSSDPKARTFVLNQGDPGLLASLERLSAVDASATHEGGASIAAHVDHLRYGLMLLGRWANGNPPPWPDMDWTASWRRNVASNAEWKALREELCRETTRWAETLATSREVSEVELGWITGSVAHAAYHFGAIRQIHRATRGPTAEDEVRARAS
jgi:hypothetical protein